MADLARDYANRAEQARVAAETEPLENVRQKHLASAAAWEELAVRTVRVNERRAAKEAADLAGLSE
ncbi:MAG TPA: hypothetical protein VJM34_13170 [Novosphingobium sp.]|nr:hypothetical protein [Novosphingobium sp.]